MSETQRPRRPKRRQRDSDNSDNSDTHGTLDTGGARDKRAPAPAGGPSSSPAASDAFSPAAAAQVEEFATTQPFPLDPFQIEAARHLAEGRSVLVAAPTGTGKALEASTPVLTPTGWVAISDLGVGDSVVGADGQPTTVLGVYPQGRRRAYRVTFTDGASVVCDLEHLWAVNTKSRRHARLPWRVLSLREILAEGLTDGVGRRHFVPLIDPVTCFQSVPVASLVEDALTATRRRSGITQRALAARLGVSQSYVAYRETERRLASVNYMTAVASLLAGTNPRSRLSPYLLGLLLGDGGLSTSMIRFTSADDELVEAVRLSLPGGATLRRAAGTRYDWYIVSSQRGTHNPVCAELRDLGLLGHRAEGKFVPNSYKFAPAPDRLALLQGLLDTDGSIGIRGDLEYTTVSPTLAEDIAFLVRSLGGRTRIRPRRTGFQTAYRLHISLPKHLTPFLLSRKALRYGSLSRHQPSRAIASVEAEGEAEMVCIAVDAADGLFVVDGFVVTHNTIVAEFAIWQTRRAGLRAIYTAPLKALSNQKFRELRERYGDAEVGLLTGDIVENPRAPIVVMTTEIYRNMLLEGARAAQLSVSQEAAMLLRSAGARDAGTLPPADDIAELARQSQLDEELSTVGCVVFDELHYLSDPSRGPVWEEAIIHSPAHVVFVGLSATVSNADELRRWIERVHGPMSLVWHDERSVPLEHYYLLDGKLHLVQDAEGRRVEYFPDIGGEAKLARMRNRQRRFTFGGEDDDDPPARITYASGSVAADRGRGKRERTSAHPTGAPARPGEQDQPTQPAQPEEPKERLAPEPGEVITALSHAGLLPCIYFLPGRRAVETAAESARGHLLVSSAQRARLHDEVQQWVRALPHEDQRLDQVQRLAALLPRGLAFHHAGLLPGLKVMVETLFQRGELRAVFATDTLALGINMPARSVVLGSMSKFDGTQMRLLTPNEYQQLTGRAGRRGLDQKGAAVIPYSPWDAFEPAFELLTGPLLPVTSAFTIRYNTILNLWRPGDANRLRIAIAASLREFQRRAGRYERAADDQAGAADSGRRRDRAGRRREPHLLSHAADVELKGTIYILRSLGYIGQDDELTVKGRLLRAVFHPAGIILADLLVNGALDGLAPAELAEVVSWFTFDDDRPLRNFNQLSQRLVQVRRDVYTAQRRVLETEYDEGLALSPGIVDAFHGVALNWSRGYSLGGMLRRIDLAEGDLLVILNQTIDLLQQVHGAVAQVLDARDLWQSARPDTRRARYLADIRARLARLRPGLDAAWRGMLRGSVAQSRAIPSMATPVAAAPAIPIPPIPMAEDEEPDVARSDRVPDGSPPAADAVDDVVVSTSESERDGSAHDRDTPPRGG